MNDAIPYFTGDQNDDGSCRRVRLLLDACQTVPDAAGDMAIDVQSVFETELLFVCRSLFSQSLVGNVEQLCQSHHLQLYE